MFVHPKKSTRGYPSLLVVQISNLWLVPFQEVSFLEHLPRCTTYLISWQDFQFFVANHLHCCSLLLTRRFVNSAAPGVLPSAAALAIPSGLMSPLSSTFQGMRVESRCPSDQWFTGFSGSWLFVVFTIVTIPPFNNDLRLA